MPEELAFARKASGLVRGFRSGTPSGWALLHHAHLRDLVHHRGRPRLFPGANLLIAILISVLTVGLGVPDRLGHPGRHHAAQRRRVHLQLAHPPPGDRHGGELRQRLRSLYWNLFNASMFAVPSLAILGPVHGLEGPRQLRDQQGRRSSPLVIGFASPSSSSSSACRLFHKLSR